MTIYKTEFQFPSSAWLINGWVMKSYYDVKGFRGKSASMEPYVVITAGKSAQDSVHLARIQCAIDTGGTFIFEKAFAVNDDSVGRQRISIDSIQRTSVDWSKPWYEAFDIVAVDTETTGLDPDKERIIEIGFSFYDKDSRSYKSAESIYVDPEGVEIGKEAMAVHGITPDKILNASTISEIFEEKLKANALNNKQMIFLAHNRGFDAGFIYKSLKRAFQHDDQLHQWPDALEEDKFCLFMPFVCSMELAIATDVGQGRTNKLGHLAKVMSVEGDNSHRAGDDCKLAGNVFLALARRNHEFRKLNAYQFMRFFDKSILDIHEEDFGKNDFVARPDYNAHRHAK